jgi:hypothetical protein
MYQVFDEFLAIETWHTCHPLDERRFFRALHQVVRNPEFSVEALRRYMLHKFELSQSYDIADYRAIAIKSYTDQAQTVRDYFEFTRDLDG